MTPTIGPCFFVRPTRAGRKPLQGSIVAIKDGGLVDVSAGGLIFSDVEFLAGPVAEHEGHNSTYAYQVIEVPKAAKPTKAVEAPAEEPEPEEKKPAPPKPPIPPAKK